MLPFVTVTSSYTETLDRSNDDSDVIHCIVDQFALPGTPSYAAMESWGLIQYKESRLLVDVKKDGAIAKIRSLPIIAHELAHTVSYHTL